MDKPPFEVINGTKIAPRGGPSQPASVGDLLSQPPAPQRYVIDGFLPEPIVAAITSPGGIGKSYLLMNLAACIAGGVPFFGHEVKRPGSVLYVSAEDDKEELRRRFWSLRESLQQLPEFDLEGFHQNLLYWAKSGEDSRLLQQQGQNHQWTALVQQIIDATKTVMNLRLIILDPVSRFRTGDENNSEDATRFVEVLEYIRKATGVTVLVAHHSNKGSTGNTADSIRGSSAFVDALRFAATLSVIHPDNASKYGLSEEQRLNLVRLSVV